MSEWDLDTVKCEIVEDHIAVVRLDNPPVNAHSAQMLADLPLMFDRLSDLDDVRAVVLTGEGKIFCAGADLKGRGERGPGTHWQTSRSARECYHSIRAKHTPRFNPIRIIISLLLLLLLLLLRG